MAKRLKEITPQLQAFIARQHLFFVATADVDGRVNVSPKGGDALRVLGPNRVVWRNLTGSGNETAAHLLACNRITLMFCSFEQEPLILRLYGRGRMILPGDEPWQTLSALFPEHVGARQLFDIDIDLVQTSCGFQVPLYDYRGERDLLDNWSAKKGRDGIERYWQEKNRLSLDGKPTGL